MPTQAATPDTTQKPRRKRKPSRYWNRAPYDPSSVVVAPKHQHLISGVSLLTAWRMRQRKEFPEPIRVSPGRVVWLRADLELWLRERAKAATLLIMVIVVILPLC